MDRFCPPAIVVDQNLEILQFRGAVIPYLQPASGQASLNLFNMTLPVLEFELRSLIDRAKSSRSDVRREGLQVEIGGVSQRLNLEVIPDGEERKSKPLFHHCLVATRGIPRGNARRGC